MSFFKNINKLAVVVVAMMVLAVLGKTFDSTTFQSSVLSLFNKIGLTDYKEEYPDLGIEKVTLTKILEPKSDFNYYKYKATIVLKNYGELLTKATVVISSGEGQKKAFVRNELYGLTLGKGESFIFDDYEVIMSGDVNYKNFKFEIDIKDEKDKDSNNNYLPVSALEEPMKFSSFDVSSYDGMDGFYFGYDLEKGREEVLNNMNLQICVATDFDGLKNENLRYAETPYGDSVYSYYKSKIDSDLISSEDFKCEDASKERGGMRAFDSLDTEHEYAVYLKAFEGGGGVALSNLVYLPKISMLTNAEFVREFVRETGMPMDPTGLVIYQDLKGDESFIPELKTMFNRGLVNENTDFRFHADDVMSRRDLLEPLLNYFDAELTVDDGAPHFADVSRNSDDYYFVEAMYAAKVGHNLGIHFNAGREASTYLLKYLIDEFKAAQN